jgi:trehalose 6-phosphate synthase
MNLVAFEYVACQEQRNGVLALSEFAGASVFMADGTVQFHPANIKEMAQCIHKGLTMSKEERKERYDKLKKFVHTNTRYVLCFNKGATAMLTVITSAKWGQSFVTELSKRHV